MATTLTAATKFTAIDKFSGKVKKMGAASRSFATTAQSSFARARRSVRSVITSTNTLTSKIFNLRNAAGVLVAGMAVKKLYDMASGIAAAGDEASKSARMMGLTAEALQELRYAAERQGVSTKLMDKSFLALNKRMGELRAGSGQLYSYLNKTGQKALINQLKNVKDSQEAFMLLTEKVKETENPMDRAALANAAFSRSGIEMVKMMENGTEGIHSLTAEARKYGFVISNEMAKKSEKYIDVQTNMTKTLEGMKMLLGVELMPRIQKISVQLTNWTLKNREFIKTKIAEYVQKVANVLKFFKNNADKIIGALKIFIGLMLTLKAVNIVARVSLIALTVATTAYNIALGVMGALTGKASLGIAANKTAMISYKIVLGAVTAAQWLWNAAMSANPIGLIIAGVVALVAVVTIIIKKWNEWGAALSIFLGPIGIVISMVQSFRRNWEMVKEAFKTEGILAGLKAVGKVILDAMIMPIQQFLGLLAKIPGVGNMIQPAIDKLQQWREGLGVNIEEQRRGNETSQSRQQVEIGVKAEPGTTATENNNTGGVPVEIGNTLGYAGAFSSW